MQPTANDLILEELAETHQVMMDSNDQIVLLVKQFTRLADAAERIAETLELQRKTDRMRGLK